MMPRSDNAIGDFLSARRKLIEPGDVGLPDFGRRRVVGLRREEVALLAGVSVHYYLRLEQGRDRHPSAQILEALGRVLGLDSDAVTYLRGLAEPRELSAQDDWVREPRPGVINLLTGWSSNPALVLGRNGDVLAANELVTALHPGFEAGRNINRVVFLDPASKTLYGDWNDVAEHAVATMRASAGAAAGDAEMSALIAELSSQSEDFRRIWARQDVERKAGGDKRFRNPIVGDISLSFESFEINSAPGQTLVVYYAEPGTPDEQALVQLTEVVCARHDVTPLNYDAGSRGN